jgi:enoyl-CoA hydratase
MVDYEVQGRVALITLNRPESRNAINREVAKEMEAALDRFEGDPDVWVGVLRANTDGQSSPVFSSGQDLKLIGSPEGNSFTDRGGFGGLAYRERTKPLIAAVDGLATAGGCELVLACDLVVATTRSSFGLAEVKRNLVAGAGGLFRLPRAIGRFPAMLAILTGDPISADRAYELGLVASLVESGEAEQAALALAGRICENAPLAVWASRRVVDRADDGTEAELRALSDEATASILRSEDLQEGLAAFRDKRPPVWKGR